MRRTVIVVVVMLAAMFGLSLVAGAQTNPCEPATSIGVLNPVSIAFTSTDFNFQEIDGSYRTTSVLVSYFLQGVSPETGQPVQSFTLQRGAFALVPGTTDCYAAALPSIPINAGTAYVAHAKQAGAAGESLWSTASNPFSVGGVPATLLRVVLIREP